MISDNIADTTDVLTPKHVIETWFKDDISGRMDLPQPKRWFMGGPELDQKLNSQYSQTLIKAGANKLDHWLESAQGTLALIIVLDQFNRNIHRGSAAAFEHDIKAVAASKHALAMGYTDQLTVSQRIFCYMPFEHDESAESQSQSVALFKQLKEDAPTESSEFAGRALASAIEHKDIIDKFGRYPHRNAVLDRVSTDDELAWLESENKRFGQ
ncbi:MAG: hypothetical protein ACI9UN_000023 [Granulosicoccus sp.]|jgi:uncharacterized protein (DUF924 family)